MDLWGQMGGTWHSKRGLRSHTLDLSIVSLTRTRAKGQWMEGPVHPAIRAVRVPAPAGHCRGPRASQGLPQQFLRPSGAWTSWSQQRRRAGGPEGRRGPAGIWSSFSPSGHRELLSCRLCLTLIVVDILEVKSSGFHSL